MLNAITTNWFNECLGVEIQYLTDQTVKCRYCIVSINSSNVSIGDKKELTGELAAVLKQLPEKPLALSINGKGVLTKKTTFMECVSQQNMGSVFPNIILENFHIQNYTSGEHSFISLIRKDLITHLIDLLPNLYLLSLGPFNVMNVVSQLNIYDHELRFDGQVLNYTPSFELLNYQQVPNATATFHLKLDIEPIQECFLVSYATAFQLLLYKKVTLIAADVPQLADRLIVFGNDKKIKLLTYIAAGVTFLLLLINFIVFFHYKRQNEQLSGLAASNSFDISEAKRLQSKIIYSEQLLNSLNWKGNIRYSYICDQIAGAVPEKVTLTEIDINSLPKDHTNEPVIDRVHENPMIRIKGYTTDLDQVNEMIYSLQSQKWVKSVKLGQFKPDIDSDNNNFSLIMTF